MAALKNWIEVDETADAVPSPRLVAAPVKTRVGDFFSWSPDCGSQTSTQVLDCDWEITFENYDACRSASLARSGEGGLGQSKTGTTTSTTTTPSTQTGRPDLEAITKDSTISAAISAAWLASNPNTKGKKIETGFWIIRDDKAKALSVQQFPSNGATNSTITPGPMPIIAGNTTISFFHTHPNTPAEGYLNVPSPKDIYFANHKSINLPGIIKAHDGFHYFGPALPK